MAGFPTECPSCHAPLRVTTLVCDGCETQLEGVFALPLLLRLPPPDLDFIVSFVRSSGSLKQMAKELGQSYPTIRSRLDRIIERLSENPEHLDTQRREILDAIATGKLSVAEAAKQLKKVGQ